MVVDYPDVDSRLTYVVVPEVEVSLGVIQMFNLCLIVVPWLMDTVDHKGVLFGTFLEYRWGLPEGRLVRRNQNVD